jgi:LysR family transcriptional regulator, putative pyruvate carboxylase regulator
MSRKPPLSPRFYYKSDTLKPLRAFCQLARMGSVSKAAESMFLSQPAVSLQLQALEREHGVRLFARSGRVLRLTREGEALFALAQPILESLDGLPAALKAEITQRPAVQLNIAAGTSTILYLLPPLVQAFRQRYPEVDLILHNVTGVDGLGLLRSDAVDLAVGSMLDVPNDLNYEEINRFDPMLITPKGHPLSAKSEIQLEDLSPYGLILPPKRLTTYRLIELVFQQRRVPYRVALEVGGWEVIKQYVAMDLGISIVTAICLQPSDLDRLHVQNVKQYFPSRSYGIVVRRGTYLTDAARRFIDLVKPGLFNRRDYFESGPSDR